MTRVLFVCLAAAAFSGCIRKSVHEDIVAQMAGEYAALEGELGSTRATLSATEAELAQCLEDREEVESTLSMTQEELTQCRLRLEEARMLLEQSDEASAALAARLQELASIEAELRERDAIFRDIVEAFQELIQNGYVEVAIERGRLVIKMPQDILFESGRADLGTDGEIALIEVATVIAALDQRQFQVEGHTDNVPIATQRFPSNWELSSARALAVVHLFEQYGVPARNISAGAFGEFRPRALNDTPLNKALNRRIEIVMVPDLEAIFGNITTGS